MVWGLRDALRQAADGGAPLLAGVAFRAFEQGDDCHGVTMAEFKIFLEPGDDYSGLDASAKRSVLGIALCRRKTLEISRALSGLCLNVVEIGLK
jgi:hypothetical protein